LAPDTDLSNGTNARTATTATACIRTSRARWADTRSATRRTSLTTNATVFCATAAAAAAGNHHLARIYTHARRAAATTTAATSMGTIAAAAAAVFSVAPFGAIVLAGAAHAANSRSIARQARDAKARMITRSAVAARVRTHPAAAGAATRLSTTFATDPDDNVDHAIARHLNRRLSEAARAAVAAQFPVVLSSAAAAAPSAHPCGGTTSWNSKTRVGSYVLIGRCAPRVSVDARFCIDRSSIQGRRIEAHCVDVSGGRVDERVGVANPICRARLIGRAQAAFPTKH
jgi:hypothetical protein